VAAAGVESVFLLEGKIQPHQAQNSMRFFPLKYYRRIVTVGRYKTLKPTTKTYQQAVWGVFFGLVFLLFAIFYCRGVWRFLEGVGLTV